MFRLFCNLTVAKKPVKSLIKKSLPAVHSFNKNCNLLLVRKLMSATGLNKRQYVAKEVPQIILPGQIYLIKDGFMKMLVVVTEVIDERLIRAVIAIPCKSDLPVRNKSSIGNISIFAGYDLFFAPKQLNDFGFVGKANGSIPVFIKQNELPRSNVMFNAYEYVRTFHGSSMSYICNETNDFIN